MITLKLVVQTLIIYIVLRASQKYSLSICICMNLDLKFLQTSLNQLQLMSTGFRSNVNIQQDESNDVTKHDATNDDLSGYDCDVALTINIYQLKVS